MQKIDNILFWFAAPLLALGYILFFVPMKLCGVPGLCNTTWHFNFKPKEKLCLFFVAVRNQTHALVETLYGYKKAFSK